MDINLIVNHKTIKTTVKPDEYLVETLRRLHYTSVKKGCDTSSCGICTILLEGSPIASCSYLSIKANNKVITTVEGIQAEAEKLADLFGEEGADQCGYCNPGLALTVYAMKQELKTPTEEDIRHYLVGNLCRCTGYVAQHKAILNYMGVTL